MDGAVPLLNVYRGGLLESVHRGAVVVMEGDEVVFEAGTAPEPVYYRSTSKPFQALVGLTSGAADAFGFTPAEIALAAGSHSTLPDHLWTARSMLAKADIPESALRCAGHFAFDPETRLQQKSAGETPIPVWSNCSGKHAMMLATAKHMGHALQGYLHPTHPVQQIIREHVALACRIPVEDVLIGTDGCSAPAFAVPLRAMARSLAYLADPSPLPTPEAEGLRRIAAAMQAHPDMIGGPGRFDTELMTGSTEVLLAKAGAEGVHGTAAPRRQLGLAVKVEDGSDRGYRLVVLALLERFGLLLPEEREALSLRFCDPELRSLARETVGRLEVLV